MIYLYVLVAISVTNIGNVHTISYHSTYEECQLEKNRLEENPTRTRIHDCWIRKAKE